MNLKIALFGIAKEIVGQPVLEVTTPADQPVQALLEQLRTQYPGLRGLSSLAVAVNNEYAEDTQLLHERDEIALIPPVAGG
ncbi:MoaD/ThiS family protein [Hymenobacter sp. BT186]|uniref:Molybdopterin synthase sulfur carrier subunit n=1 Tax=Hymenobacter telluris TaxID=2816474 RepID=A0A939JC43_9BACT|nr:MoaD/ThiS family protein [Hymenobacter telluris]MBO0359801.1 MoaD/ThiS family protein [Hymenobacter telluris]MBW3375828.1 MoaD/ThiS family protein [Hymenobacter norwichensis]